MKNTHLPRILHLLSGPYVGGAETNLLALMHHFDQDRFEHAVAFGGSGQLEQELAQIGVRLIRLSPQPLSLRAMFDMPVMVRKIADFRPDIIHSHLDLPNLVALVAKRALGCKVVLHFHGIGIVPRSYFPGSYAKRLFWNVMAHLYRYSNKAIAICSFQLPFLAKLGMSDDKVVLIPNGISLGGEQPVRVSTDGAYRFVNVGRFFPQKDHALLIRAFAEVNLDFPQTRLTLVGDGPLRSDVEKQIQEMGLQDKVELLGMRRDIPEILAEHDCFVLNSRWELHPITILEAMRAGLPVIASDVGGVADTVMDKVTGLVVKSGDQQALAEAMSALANMPKKGAEMGEQGRHLVSEKFSNDVVARKIEAVYQELLREEK